MRFASYPVGPMFVLAFLGSLNQFAESEADERLTDAELSEVLNRHESAIALVHSADVTVNVQSTEREGVQQTPPVAMWKLRWSKDGSKSRIRCENLHSSAVDERGDSVRRFVDVLEDGHKINMLLNWDPIKRPALQARDQRSVQAYTYPPSPQLPGLVVNLLQQHALFEIGANAFDARRSIRQLIAQSPGKGDARVVEIEGQKLIALKIDHPDTKFGKTFKNTRFEIYIDPAFNHLVRRVVVLTPPNEKIGAKTGLIEDRVVRRFEAFGNGVFFPTLVEVDMKSHQKSRSNAKYRLEVMDITINDDLPPDAMDFQFPENCIVVHNPPVDGRRKGTLYGRNNVPAKEVASIHELPQLTNSDNETWFSGFSLYWTSMLIFGLLFVVAFILRLRIS